MKRAELLDRLAEMEARARVGGGPDRIAERRAAGRWTARERIRALLDPDSFVEIDAVATARSGAGPQVLGDGVVTGRGTIRGRLVHLYAQDATVFGGAVSGAHAAKICKVMEHATRAGTPIIGLCDSAGGRIQDAMAALGGSAEILFRAASASGVVPQISAVLGPCAGSTAYTVALTDFVAMVEGQSQMFVTGPEVLRSATGRDVGLDELGGVDVHTTTSGAAHFAVSDEAAMVRLLVELLTFLPANNRDPAPRVPTDDPPDRLCPELEDVVPTEPAVAYDMGDVVRAVVDDGHFLEVHRAFGPNLLAGFARLDGRSVGVVANQPLVRAGSLDVDSTVKAARFVRFCDAFNLPIVTFVDAPGFMPGIEQEALGILRHGAKLLYAFAEATVPRVTVITRKAYGGGYSAMSPQQLGGDWVFAWPTAEIAVTGPVGAARVLERRALAESEDPAALEEQLVADYRAEFANPYRAAEVGFVDAVLRPEQTRQALVGALRDLEGKYAQRPDRKHGTMPL